MEEIITLKQIEKVISEVRKKQLYKQFSIFM